MSAFLDPRRARLITHQSFRSSCAIQILNRIIPERRFLSRDQSKRKTTFPSLGSKIIRRLAKNATRELINLNNHQAHIFAIL